MNRLVFKAADVHRVVEHSIAAPKQGGVVVDYDVETGKAITKPVSAPAVLLVHDKGVYLMSNSEPRDIMPGANSVRSFVAYALGCHPITDPDWREMSRSLVGGDDFGKTLPWANEIKALLEAGAREIVIEVSDGGLKLLS
jgi:hypothetical protein